MHICDLVAKLYSRTHVVGECEMYKKERDMLEEMRKVDECDMEEFGTLDSSENTIAIPGGRWWLQTAKQKGDMMTTKKLQLIRIVCTVLRNRHRKRNERPNDGVVSINRSRSGDPSHTGCVANGQITQA